MATNQMYFPVEDGQAVQLKEDADVSSESNTIVTHFLCTPPWATTLLTSALHQGD